METRIMHPTDDDPILAGDRLLNSRTVRRRYDDASDMWLWRRLNDGSGFPRPLEIRGRRFWRLSELIEWERNLSRAKGPELGGGVA